MVDDRQILGTRVDIRPWQLSFQRIFRLSSLAASGSSGAVWRVRPLQSYLTAMTTRFFLILGALLVLGDVVSVVFALSESSAITATAILIALASAFAMTAEFKPDSGKARMNLVTSARLPLSAGRKAMASSATQ